MNNLQINKTKLKNNLFEIYHQQGFFGHEFGMLTKAEYELALFNAMYNSLDGEVNDHNLSILLGITESKARNLRVKSFLNYPTSVEWKDALSESIKHGKYDKNTDKITLSIEDPVIYNHIKYLIEKDHNISDTSFNKKNMILDFDSLVKLISLLEDDSNDSYSKYTDLKSQWNAVDTQRKLIKGLKIISDINTINSFLACFTKGVSIAKLLVDLIKNFNV